MEFNEKLQQLRKQKGITQDQLAESLFVSRTAISKWESGRGYPNIDSIKAIARFYSVTIDELLSGEQALDIAQREKEQKAECQRTVVLGLADVFAIMLLFFPFFAEKTPTGVWGVSLISLGGVGAYLKIAYVSIVTLITLTGVITLALGGARVRATGVILPAISISLSVGGVLLFIVGLHPYAATFALALLAIKLLALQKVKTTRIVSST